MTFTRDSNRRHTSRTWQPYSNGEHTCGCGRTASNRVDIETAVGARLLQDPGPVLVVGFNLNVLADSFSG